EMRYRVRDVAVHAYHGAGRQILGKRRGRVEKKRQIVFDAGRRDAVGDVLVQWRSRRIAFEHFAEPTAEARARRVVGRKLPRRQKAHLLNGIYGSLAVDVESSDRFDFLVEQIDPVRQRTAHRVQIDEAAAYAEFARRDDLRHVLISG